MIAVATSAPSFLPPYPTEDDVILPPHCSQYQMAQLLAFYQNYCRSLARYMINLDFESAAVRIAWPRAFVDESLDFNKMLFQIRGAILP